jgi:hypothetical protein
MTASEAYSRRVVQLAMEMHYSDVVFFPMYRPEEVANDLVGCSESLCEDFEPDAARFSCSICGLTQTTRTRVGECMHEGCRNVLGACCLYDRQWNDQLEQFVPFPKGTRFLCPHCIEYKLC